VAHQWDLQWGWLARPSSMVLWLVLHQRLGYPILVLLIIFLPSELCNSKVFQDMHDVDFRAESIVKATYGPT
jgi:hypothetical protein